HQVYFNVRDGRGVISIAKEKVAFLLCYLNCVLLGAKFSYLGLPRQVIFCILAYYRQIRRAFLACVGGPMDHDLWYGSSISPFGLQQRWSSEAWASQ
ncbi:hypothetical protein GE21DRAFT_1219608, partial [Neurospora crassa]